MEERAEAMKECYDGEAMVHGENVGIASPYIGTYYKSVSLV